MTTLNGNFKDLYNMGSEHVFAGLSSESKEFLRKNGLWYPINHELLDTLPGLSNKKDLIYVSRVDKDVLMFILVEQGEYLQGIVYDLIQEKGGVPATLHEYQLVDGTTAKEGTQLIVDDNLFLYLYGESDIVMGEWKFEEIEKYLKDVGY